MATTLESASSARLRPCPHACFWQSFVDEQEFMTHNFKATMFKLAFPSHDRASLMDCSDGVPAPKHAVNKPATVRASTGPKGLELSCFAERLPALPVAPGATQILISHCSHDGQDCATVPRTSGQLGYHLLRGSHTYL
ncbi:hypothetical protein CERSUDRAFT_114041 [Gelatoporia subvermispora B]|uniref:Fungal ligninase C-terminal domain-containing protein n=1 Tax=Ceriporiopsis subvermispora (strain B) TaxID=914234 RepID=M2QK20_CERS8|nr:hypothetical protein CERSUDRAFT_114041 [Gelatoporia subvermispora B]